jgi:hypothetical protein
MAHPTPPILITTGANILVCPFSVAANFNLPRTLRGSSQKIALTNSSRDVLIRDATLVVAARIADVTAACAGLNPTHSC